MTQPFLPIVAVPVKNEERRLPALLAALAHQAGAGQRPLPVVVVLNNCSDGSLAAARAASLAWPALRIEAVAVDFPPAAAHVGSARRLAMDAAFDLCASPEQSVILTTDADSVPEPGWVAANLAAVAAGADLVGGRIIGDPAEERQLGPGFLRRARLTGRYALRADRLAALIDPLAHDPWPRHRDHTGASLAVRADVYRAVGGMPALPLREDLAFVSKARGAGYRLRHAPAVRIHVSARLAGRAAGGMADCLKGWMRAEAEGLPLLVEDPERVLARLRRRRALRGLDLSRAGEREAAAALLGVEADALLADGRPLPTAALVERFAPDEPDAPASVPVEAALAAIEAMIPAAEGEARAA